MASSTFTVGGLASGMDTQSIIEKLTQLESRPLDQLKKQQSGYKTQVSALGALASKLGALRDAARDLATKGALGAKVTSTHTSFAAEPGPGAVAGSYDLRVGTLAGAAKWRSDGFAAGETVRGGTLSLALDGAAPLQVAVADGATLGDVAAAIRASGAAVTAVVLDDGVRKWLSVSAAKTGFDGADPHAALAIAFTATGTQGKDPGLSERAAAVNATFSLDGLDYVRRSNTVTDAVPGVTLTLKAAGGAAETLGVANDAAATQARLKGFVDAYNDLARALQAQLAVTKDTDRAATLAGDAAVRSLQARLQALGSAAVPGLGAVRSLADLGVKNERDGSLSVDASALAAALGRDAAAVNAVFATADGGLAQLTSTLAEDFTAPGTGLLSVRQGGLQDQLRRMDEQAVRLQLRIDTFRATLVEQFTAMEKTVSGLKNIGSFLTSQSLSASK
jgi:flagellar hook-associated protein 2